MHLPVFLKNIIGSTPTPNCGTIIRIAYHGESASQPILSYLIKHYPITINILQGNIETIQHQIAGIMIVEMKGTPESVTASCAFLTQNGLPIEILGYVA
jgi:D-methionine transport system ATP-binding protein